MNPPSGGHLELPEDEFHRPDNDMQITFKWTLTPIPSSFLCVPGTLSLCISADFTLLSVLLCLHTTAPFLPAGLSSKSDTVHLGRETWASATASRVYRNCPAPGFVTSARTLWWLEGRGQGASPAQFRDCQGTLAKSSFLQSGFI